MDMFTSTRRKNRFIVFWEPHYSISSSVILLIVHLFKKSTSFKTNYLNLTFFLHKYHHMCLHGQWACTVLINARRSRSWRMSKDQGLRGTYGALVIGSAMRHYIHSMTPCGPLPGAAGTNTSRVYVYTQSYESNYWHPTLDIAGIHTCTHTLLFGSWLKNSNLYHCNWFYSIQCLISTSGSIPLLSVYVALPSVHLNQITITVKNLRITIDEASFPDRYRYLLSARPSLSAANGKYFQPAERLSNKQME